MKLNGEAGKQRYEEIQITRAIVTATERLRAAWVPSDRTPFCAWGCRDAHVTHCPTWTAATVCPDCGGTGAVPALHEPEDQIDNGYAPCTTCQEDKQ